MRMCGFASNCARICVRAQVHLCVHTRVRACVCAGVRLCARASVFCRSIGKHLRALCVRGCEHSAGTTMCVCLGAVCAATCGINSSAGGAGRPRVRGCGSVRSALGVVRIGRRCDVDEPHDQRAMGRPRWAHVGGRRRRRHLRHRRHQRRRHLLQRRVGQHRRRCAAGLSGYLGVLSGTNGVLRGS
jgi:hypothetical protein